MLIIAGLSSPPSGIPWTAVHILYHFEGADATPGAGSDSSSYNRSITGDNSGEIDTAQKKFGSSSEYFDVTNTEFFRTWSPSTSGPSSDDFTCEAWIRLEGLGNTSPIFQTGDGAHKLYVSSANKLTWGYSTTVLIQDSATLSANTWYHICIMKYNGTWLLFKDGVRIGSSVQQLSLGALNIVGASGGAPVGYFDGWIDEFIWINGYALRDLAGFTAPTAAFTDGDALPLPSHTGTHAGVNTAQAKFGAASLRINNDGGLIDVSGDYVYYADHADFVLGSSDFTIEAWIRVDNATPTYGHVIASQWDATSTISDRSFILGLTAAGYANAHIGEGGSPAVTLTGSTAVTANTWHHIALVRDGNDWELFLDGVSQDTDTVSYTVVNCTHPLTIGGYENIDNCRFGEGGYIDDFRMVVGTAVYTANFTPPTSALTAITNTKILLPFNTDLDDDGSTGHVGILRD